jgi:hypothetical protein
MEEKFAEGINLPTCIRKVTDSNIGQDTEYTEVFFLWFSSIHPENFKRVPQNMALPLPSTICLSNLSLIILPFDATYYELLSV